MSLSPAFLDELRSRITLSSLIEREVKLTKAGREKKGCCPFHSEKSASFYVNDDKAFYHCFGCSAHGDVITWMTDHKGLPFMDAVKELAAGVGLEMPARDSRYAEREREQEGMFAIMHRAAEWFQQRKAGSDEAMAYLERRSISPGLAMRFGIGWAPAGRAVEPLHRHLKDVAPETLVKLGLAKIHEDGDRKGEVFDFFRGRVMFPIRDNRGRVIGFGGRVLGDQQPKYLNSPDTPIFDKGRTLFNVDRAASAARSTGRLLVVEGYMDVIGLAAAGVDHAVAPNGTALTEEQINRLWRIEKNPILCFDGDKAGRAAAARAAIRALPLLEPDKSLFFVTPPDGKDPDDVAREGGAAAIDAMLSKPQALVDLIWQHEAAAGPVDTPEQRAGLAQRLRQHAESIRNAAVGRAYYEEFKARFEAVPKAVYVSGPRRAQRTERPPSRRQDAPQTAASKAIGRNGMAQNVERAVLAGLLRHPIVASREMEALSAAKFTHDAAKALRDAIVDEALERRDFTVPGHLERAADFARSGPLRFSFTTDGADPAQAERDLADAIYQLRR